MIEIRRLCTGYGREDVLRDIDLTVPDGQVTVLLGPNGSGKSTLLKTLVGITPLRSGDVLIDGESIAALSPRQLAQRLSYMAQTRNTPNIVARRMVLHGRFPYLSYPRRYSKRDEEIAMEALRQADALELAERAMTELSGGQRQKVYLAMTLAQDTRTVLMDEPMNFLDVRHQLSLMDTAKRLAHDGRAVLLVMHDIRLAMQSADRLVVMDGGTVAAQGDADTLLHTGVIDRVFSVGLRCTDTEHGAQYYYVNDIV